MKNIIAIVEDDTNQRQHYAEALRNADYQVVEYADKDSALEGFNASMPDLAILDIILKQEVGGGFDVCRFLKERDAKIPVIFLTSRGNELDQIYGLQLGAWDYQTKPVSLDYLITRVHSLFQIKHATTNGQITTAPDSSLRVGDMKIDETSMAVQWKNQSVNLTPSEYEILLAILKSPKGVSMDALIKATKQGLVEGNTINTHILHIRKKLKHIDNTFNCIKTKYGFGYCWVC